MSWKIYHNPNCSKSRACLSILGNIRIDVVDYLNSPPSVDELRVLAKKLGLRPKEFVRKGEPVFSSLQLDLENDEAVFQAIHRHPILLERPILETEDAAIVGRPPERVSDFLAKNGFRL